MMPDLMTKLGLKSGPEFSENFADNLGTESEQNSDGIPTEFEQDPAPSVDLPDPPPEIAGKRGPRATSKRPTGRPAGRPTNLEKQVAEELTMYAEIIAAVWEVRDPVCGAVAAQQAPQIAAAVSRILRRYPQLMARMHASGQVGDWIALGMACAPVGKAVWSHHIADHGEEDTDSDDTTGGAGLADRYPAFTGIPRTGSVG